MRQSSPRLRASLFRLAGVTIFVGLLIAPALVLSDSARDADGEGIEPTAVAPPTSTKSECTDAKVRADQGTTVAPASDRPPKVDQPAGVAEKCEQQQDREAPADPECQTETVPALAVPKPGMRPQSDSPPCPSTSECAGPGDCSAGCYAGTESSTDLNIEACELPGGGEFRCEVGTIYLYTAPCLKCSCCTTFPACICPQNCGTHARLDCPEG